jgi:hypothetical protein
MSQESRASGRLPAAARPAAVPRRDTAPQARLRVGAGAELSENSLASIRELFVESVSNLPLSTDAHELLQNVNARLDTLTQRLESVEGSVTQMRAEAHGRSSANGTTLHRSSKERADAFHSGEFRVPLDFSVDDLRCIVTGGGDTLVHYTARRIVQGIERDGQLLSCQDVGQVVYDFAAANRRVNADVHEELIANNRAALRGRVAALLGGSETGTVLKPVLNTLARTARAKFLSRLKMHICEHFLFEHTAPELREKLSTLWRERGDEDSDVLPYCSALFEDAELERRTFPSDALASVAIAFAEETETDVYDAQTGHSICPIRILAFVIACFRRLRVGVEKEHPILYLGHDNGEGAAEAEGADGGTDEDDSTDAMAEAGQIRRAPLNSVLLDLPRLEWWIGHPLHCQSQDPVVLDFQSRTSSALIPPARPAAVPKKQTTRKRSRSGLGSSTRHA